MRDEDGTSAARVRRLIAWLKAHKRDSLDDDGEPSPTWLAANTWKTAEREDNKSTSYWSDVLRIPQGAPKSFGARAARDTERDLEMPHLHLEGAGWPFETVDQELFDALSERQKGVVEAALRDTIQKLRGATSPDSRIVGSQEVSDQALSIRLSKAKDSSRESELERPANGRGAQKPKPSRPGRS